nr:serine/threonine-protein kinase [Longispora albida]
MTTEAPSTPGVAGATIGGRYVLRSSIGSGGMGTVWKAYDQLLRRDVAIKEVKIPAAMAKADREVLIERTLREARASAGLNHPAVVRMFDVVTEGGRPWLVMELLAARSVAEIVTEDGPMSPRATAKIGLAMLGALEAAHAAGVLHRDVKPANVLIGSDGRCVLTDFGVARLMQESDLTTPGMVLGSPHYIAPERAMGGAFGPPSDLFSLGVTLYTAVEGGPPFDRGDPIETMHAVVQAQPEQPRRAGPLAPILYGLLEKDPRRRWDVHRTRQALRELIDGALANRQPRQEETDPHAVIRVAPPAPPPQPQGEVIGGRAMLAPGETPAQRAARSAPSQQAPWSPPAAPVSPAAPVPSAADLPTGAAPALEATGHHLAVSGVDTGEQSTVNLVHGPGASHQHGAGQPPLHQSPVHQHGAGHPQTMAQQGPMPPLPPGQQTAMLPPGLSLTPRPVRRQYPRWLIPAGAGALGLILIVVFSVVFFSGGDETPKAKTSPSPTGPGFPVEEYKDARGFSLNVPKGWVKKATATYVDFVEPNETGRRIRLNVESASSTAKAWAEVAAKGLQQNKNNSCPQYTLIGVRDVSQGVQNAAELEYTCDTGPKLRHGKWRGVRTDSRVFTYYLSVPETQFAESQPIYEEMNRSFRLETP